MLLTRFLGRTIITVSRPDLDIEEIQIEFIISGRSMNMSLQGKRVVIVGGTSGIGFATAQAFLDESAHVIIASRSAEKLAQAKQRLGEGVEGYELDFRSEEKAAEFFAKVGPFDHLVVTAGEMTMGDFRELPVEEVQQSFNSKFWGQYITVKAATPYLNASGSVTLTSGVYGARPPKGASTFAAINSAVEGLARGLTVDLAPVRVNVISPGLVATELYGGMPEESRQGMFDAVAKQLPVGRVGQPEDLAATYVYLAKNGFTTGSVVLIDGGALLS
jgi:NAD(P)-dependent dehydrogenase (short-subunit alcohol dehydrogenase family)